jgi:GNAT superfamily N-acetyltransferase
MSDDWQLGSMAYWHRRCATLEGKDSSTAGCCLITLCRARFGWGGIPDGAWPNATISSGVEPPGLDEIARKQRIRAYWRVDSLRDMQQCLSFHPPFSVHAAFPVTHDWFYAPEAHISSPPSDTPIIGTHAIVLEGYSIPEQRIRFWNPWKDWGNRGYGTMTIDFFERNLREAWCTLPGPLELVQTPGYKCLNNGYWTPLGLAHVITLHNSAEDERVAWAILVEKRGLLDLQDVFVKPQYRRRGHGRKLVQEIRRLRREQVSQTLPLVSSVCLLDADMFLAPIEKLASRLGLDLQESFHPWSRYSAVPKR